MPHIALGLFLIIVTTIVHAGGMMSAIRLLKLVHAGSWNMESPWARVTVVTIVVIVMSVVSFLEIAIWAGTYLIVGAVSGLEKAFYFSSVTYSTLGYGDIVLTEPWRIMASFEAVNGIIMFGWTTALIAAAVHRVYFHDLRPPQSEPHAS